MSEAIQEQINKLQEEIDRAEKEIELRRLLILELRTLLAEKEERKEKRRTINVSNTECMFYRYHGICLADEHCRTCEVYRSLKREYGETFAEKTLQAGIEHIKEKEQQRKEKNRHDKYVMEDEKNALASKYGVHFWNKNRQNITNKGRKKNKRF